MSNKKTTIYRPDRLAYWYFRLNGFLTTENFVVHPDTGRNQGTDADLLAVRFSNRAENLTLPMVDDPIVADCNTFANVIIAEIKRGQCALNGPWTDRKRMNMNRVLKSVGCIPDSTVQIACESLYDAGKWSDAQATIRVFAVGESKTKELPIAKEQQLVWEEIIEFVVDRFKEYELQKSSVGQWAEDGKELKRLALRGDKEGIRKMFGLEEKPEAGKGK